VSADPSYHLRRPVVSDALVAVHRAHGPRAAAVWAELLTAAGMAGHEADTSALERLIAAMAGLDPVTRLVGHSLRIRLSTYQHLSAAHEHLAAATVPYAGSRSS
jgi:hypothetical protein